MTQDNYGDDEVFGWLNGEKKPEAKPTTKRKCGRKTNAELEAKAKAEKEEQRAELHEKQRAEAEWKSPVDEATLKAWNSITNDFWFA
jgi:hypothetical protein